MRICRLRLYNFRTFEDETIRFSSYYSAICGKNDAGKTNALKAIRILTQDFPRFFLGEKEVVTFEDDFPKWQRKDASDSGFVEIELMVKESIDEGLFRFLTEWLNLTPANDEIHVSLRKTFAPDGTSTDSVTVGEAEYDTRKAEEVVNKLKTSDSVIFHSSGAHPESWRRGYLGGGIGEFTGRDNEELKSLRSSVNNKLNRIARQHQSDIEKLLGRLERKYKVGLSVATFDLRYLPYNVTLADKSVVVPLTDWGSGTQNRTLILMALFKAKQISQQQPSASKITPIIVIEEPESFLHPSAQAEFGRVLQDLSNEFQVQVIVTTHSPFMLNQAEPASNILLERQIENRQQRATRVMPTDSSNWMRPFGLALGVASEEFEPWRDLFYSSADRILLVEGAIDRNYFELLKGKEHGPDALCSAVDVFGYGGIGGLRNPQLIKFILQRYDRTAITFDLDCIEQAESILKPMGLVKGRDYLAIGIDGERTRNIEGLVPSKIKEAVYARNPTLVETLVHGSSGEQKRARVELKQFIFEEFKIQAKPISDDFAQFYKLTRKINSILSS